LPPAPAAERDARMVLTDDDHLMLSHRRHVRRDPLRAVAHFDIRPHSFRSVTK
jgi:hypothetical protein